MQFSKIFKSLLYLSAALFFILSLFSYKSDDPSFNVSTNSSPENLLGIIGACTADSLLQLLGLAAFIVALIPLSWAFIYLNQSKISAWFLRIIAGIIALNAAALTFYPLPLKGSYFNEAGGALGILWYEFLIKFFDKQEIYIVSSIIFITSLLFSLALNIETWGQFLTRTTSLITAFLNSLLNALKFIFNKFSFSFPSINENEKEISPSNKRLAPILSSSKEAYVKPSSSEKIEISSKKLVEKAKSLSEYPSTNSSNGFILPSTNLLKEFSVNKDNLTQNNALIKKHTEELSQILSDFGVNGEIIGASSGPVVTLYELEPAAGTKSSRIIGLSDDISRSMRAISARIAVIPGRNAIGIELPNKQRETVYLKELLESSEYRDKKYDLPIILGKDISGNVVVADLARMPHLLVAGTTGSGKSVAINTMILSLVYALTPDECKFIMVDPKMLELSVYDGIPHLLTNVVTEPGKAVVALKWVVKEMENRYRLMSNLSVRNIHNYNERIKEAVAKGEQIKKTVQTGFDPETGQPKIEQIPLDMKTLPFIVVIVDEMADLMLVAGKDIETSIQRLAQMARAAGIHIIMATQRPSVDVITGVIKANFPTRISFQVTSKIDSRTILGEQGAEQLLGKGDMLYMAGGSKISRIHGPFVADEEVERIVSYLKSQGTPSYMSDITSDDDTGYSSSTGTSNTSESDDLYRQAIEIVQLEGKVSTSFVQRCLKIGYNRAANIVEQMEKEGLISKPNHVGKREILM
ncbi:MAG: DNA translocase FtsK 4TM domain-containing protein [Rickettsiales bacterium]